MNLEDIKAVDFVAYNTIYKALLNKKKIETQIEELQLELEEQDRFIEKSLLRFKTSIKILVVVTSEHKEENVQVSNWLIPTNAQVKVCNIYDMPLIDAYNKGVEMAMDDDANFIFFTKNHLIMPENILNIVLDMAADGKTMVSDFYTTGVMFAPTQIFINNKFSDNFTSLVVESGYKLLLYNFNNLAQHY